MSVQNQEVVGEAVVLFQRSGCVPHWQFGVGAEVVQPRHWHDSYVVRREVSYLLSAPLCGRSIRREMELDRWDLWVKPWMSAFGLEDPVASAGFVVSWLTASGSAPVRENISEVSDGSSEGEVE